jgi:hypothetical protein
MVVGGDGPRTRGAVSWRIPGEDAMNDDDVNEQGRRRGDDGQPWDRSFGGTGGVRGSPAERSQEGGDAPGGSGAEAGGFLGGLGAGKAIGAGALVAAGVMLLAANREKLKPLVKGTMKEYYRFSDWVGSNFAEVKEDLSDMAAEARHEHEQEVTAHLELVDRERQLVQRLANMARKRSEEG